MRKLTRKSLDELAKIYPVLSEREQRGYVAGTSPTGSVTGVDRSCVSAYSLDILSRLGNVLITSTARSSERQAQAMLDNIKRGFHIRYLEPGTAVQNVYDASLSDAQNLKNMTDKIEEVGASNVSLHCLSNFNELNVVDIAKGAITTTQLDGMRNSGVILDYINEERCYHIVIPQKK